MVSGSRFSSKDFNIKWVWHFHTGSNVHNYYAMKFGLWWEKWKIRQWKMFAMDVVSLCSYKRQSTMYKHTTNEDIWSENAFYHKSAEAKMWTSEKLTIVHCTCRSCRSIWAYGIRNWWIVLINTRVRNKNILVLFSMLWNFPKWKFLILVWSSLVHY